MKANDVPKVRFLGAILLLLGLVGIVGMANGQILEKLVIDVDMQKGENITLSGTVMDQNSNPIQGATLNITAGNDKAQIVSNEDGTFTYKLPSVPTSERLAVNVKAEKDGYATGYANTSFFISGNTENKPAGREYKITTPDKLKDDPIAQKILENIEQSKNEEAKRQKKLQEIKEHQEFIEKQREIANQRLLDDINGWFGQFDPFKPRNAFTVFVSQVDTTVQSIYWGQFNFTETKTREGMLAMQEILNNNGTMYEARKAFHETAASTQSEINNLNNVLNSMYGKNHTNPVD